MLDAMGGSTILPIRSAEVTRHCREILEVTETEDLLDFVYIVAAMDEGFLNLISKKREAASKAAAQSP